MLFRGHLSACQNFTPNFSNTLLDSFRFLELQNIDLAIHGVLLIGSKRMVTRVHVKVITPEKQKWHRRIENQGNQVMSMVLIVQKITYVSGDRMCNPVICKCVHTC
jgi:hypothetical protein